MDLNLIKRRLQCPGTTQEDIPKIVEETVPLMYDIPPPPPNSEVFTVPEDFEFSLIKGPDVFVNELSLDSPVFDFRPTTRKGRKSRQNFQDLLLTILI
jgi:hypothetical protein